MYDLRKSRIQLLDALRGFAVVLMVLHHFAFDLVVFIGAPVWLYLNPVFSFLQYVFAGLFIMISGISCYFSRSNIRRGARVFAVAFAITLVTSYLNMTIRFGILHLLGFCMVYYGVTHRFFRDTHRPTALVLFAVMTVITALLTKFVTLDADCLWMFGWVPRGFFSVDYYPIFPWLFVFLFGTVLGRYLREGRFPKRFYEISPPFFPTVGRHALIVYILHQPVLYGITLLLRQMIIRCST